jgi:hypothetical protein
MDFFTTIIISHYKNMHSIWLFSYWDVSIINGTTHIRQTCELMICYMICSKQSPNGMLMYLPKSLFLLQRTSQIISTYMCIVDVPTLNMFDICLGLNSWTNLYNTTIKIFLIFNCDFTRLIHLDFKNVYPCRVGIRIIPFLALAIYVCLGHDNLHFILHNG